MLTVAVTMQIILHEASAALRTTTTRSPPPLTPSALIREQESHDNVNYSDTTRIPTTWSLPPLTLSPLIREHESHKKWQPFITLELLVWSCTNAIALPAMLFILLSDAWSGEQSTLIVLVFYWKFMFICNVFTCYFVAISRYCVFQLTFQVSD